MPCFDVTTTPWYACRTFEHVSLHIFQAHIFFRKDPPCGDQPQLNGPSIKEIIIHTMTQSPHSHILSYFFLHRHPRRTYLTANLSAILCFGLSWIWTHFHRQQTTIYYKIYYNIYHILQQRMSLTPARM